MLIHSTSVPVDFLKFRNLLPDPNNQCLAFLDIETLGLNRGRDPIILIGMMLLGPDSGQLHQYFAQDIADEENILRSLMENLPPGSLVLTYNGRSFDIPYINHRLVKHGLPYRIPAGRGIDLMYWAKKALPDAPRHTLKAVEICLGIQRQDTLSGLECVHQYQTYLKTKAPELASQICQHNYEDILHMAPLLQLYAKLPLDSPLRSVPFRISVEQQDFWIESPAYSNGFLMLKGMTEQIGSYAAIHYSGSASLKITQGNLDASLPVIEFTYPSPGSLYIDPDRIPGFSPLPFNALSLEDKMGLLVRSGIRYLPDPLTFAIKRLLSFN